MHIGERWHYGRVLYHPTDQPAQVLATFMTDDDDGNLDSRRWLLQPTDDDTHRWCGRVPYPHPGSDRAGDVDGGATSVYSPEYDLSGVDFAKAKYFRWYSNDRGYNPGEDIWVVQVRNNGGAWVDVERNQDDMNSWQLRGVDLIAEFGEDLGTVQLKFIASDEGSGSLVEALVDDFELLVDFGMSEAPESPVAGLRFAFPGPRANPIVGATEISFQVPATTLAQLALYDVGGRLVRTLLDDVVGPSAHHVAWDGRGRSGETLSSGVYYLRLEAPGFEATRTVVLSR